MRQENVVPFEPFARSGMARRGAPDKTRTCRSRTLEVECPRCFAVLRLEAAVAATSPEVLCLGCHTTISLDEGEAADIG